jgi:hypothetical protein
MNSFVIVRRSSLESRISRSLEVSTDTNGTWKVVGVGRRRGLSHSSDRPDHTGSPSWRTDEKRVMKISPFLKRKNGLAQSHLS